MLSAAGNGTLLYTNAWNGLRPPKLTVPWLLTIDTVVSVVPAAVAALIGLNVGTSGATVPAGTGTARFEYTSGQDGGGWQAHIPMVEAVATRNRHRRPEARASPRLIALRPAPSESASSRRPTDRTAVTAARTRVRANQSPHPRRPRP